MNETARLRYIKDRELYSREKPYVLYCPVAGVPSRNIIFDEGPEQVITDVRGREEEFTLELHGFVFKKAEAPENIDWKNPVDIEERYVPAVQNIVKELLGGGTMSFPMWEWKQRRAGSLVTHRSQDETGVVQLAPAYLVHIDLTPYGVVEWMRSVLGVAKANDLIGRYRVRIINVWRSLIPVVEDVALALGDARTADPQNNLEVSEVMHVLPGNTRYNFYLKHDDKLRFYYLSNMTDQEICALVVFDSENEYKQCPHGSFRLGKYRNGEQPSRRRESIEMRILALS